MNQGWECPKCHTVWNPTVQKCAQCSPVAVPCEPLYPPTGEPPYWRYIPWTPPTWEPLKITCITTGGVEGYTYTLYNGVLSS